MNKIETKKHWYDKPLRFLYFLAVLFPAFVFLFNFVTFQTLQNNKFTINTSTTPTGNTMENHYSSDLNNSPYENVENDFRTPIDNTIWYTNYFLLGSQNLDNIENLELTDIENYTGYPPFLRHLFRTLLNTNLFISLDIGDNNSTYTCMFNLDFLLTNILFYEVYITFLYILLRVILFLPNVICYLLDWVERRLGKL